MPPFTLASEQQRIHSAVEIVNDGVALDRVNAGLRVDFDLDHVTAREKGLGGRVVGVSSVAGGLSDGEDVSLSVSDANRESAGVSRIFDAGFQQLAGNGLAFLQDLLASDHVGRAGGRHCPAAAGEAGGRAVGIAEDNLHPYRVEAARHHLQYMVGSSPVPYS